MSPASTPARTTLFELMVAAVVPVYALLFAVSPEVTVTVAGFTTWVAEAEVEVLKRELPP